MEILYMHCELWSLNTIFRKQREWMMRRKQTSNRRMHIYTRMKPPYRYRLRESSDLYKNMNIHTSLIFLSAVTGITNHRGACGHMDLSDLVSLNTLRKHLHAAFDHVSATRQINQKSWEQEVTSVLLRSWRGMMTLCRATDDRPLLNIEK